MGRMSDAQRELTEETRSANLEIAKQIGHLRTALNLEVDMASANELRQGIQQITQELDNFNAAALSSQVEVDFGGEGGGVRVKNIGAIGDQLSPLLQKELGQKLNDQISFLTAQAISQGLFGDDALAFIQGNMQKVVDSTVNNFRSGLEGRRSEMQEALAAMLEPDGGDDSGLDNLLGSDETVDDLFKMLENFGHFTESTTDKIKRQFNEAIETLQVQSGLGIIDDLTLAQSALAEIENALTNSVLADPNFINTEQFALLNEQMTALKALLAENKTEVKEVNDALFNSAQMGNLAGELIGAGFKPQPTAHRRLAKPFRTSSKTPSCRPSNRPLQTRSTWHSNRRPTTWHRVAWLPQQRRQDSSQASKRCLPRSQNSTMVV